jgi:hypothetical protein
MNYSSASVMYLHLRKCKDITEGEEESSDNEYQGKYVRPMNQSQKRENGSINREFSYLHEEELLIGTHV